MNQRRLPVRPLAAALLLAVAATPLCAQDAGSQFGMARSRELAELGLLPSSRDVVVRDLLNYHRHRLRHKPIRWSRESPLDPVRLKTNRSTFSTR